jgi:hypothetical protein
MAAKKLPANVPQPAALEQRVDALMDPQLQAVVAINPDTVLHDSNPLTKPINGGTDAKTAPHVPAALLKRLKAPSRIEHREPIAALQPETAAVITKAIPPALNPVAVETTLPTNSPTSDNGPLPASESNEPQAEPVTSDWVGPRQASLPESVRLEDSGLDAAVADIAAHEGDELLAAQDALADDQSSAASRIKPKHTSSTKKRRWLLAGGVIIALIALAAVWPTSRYKLAGLVINKTVSVEVRDATTHAPVSDAQIELSGTQMVTNADGIAHIAARPGKQTIAISKGYYQTKYQAVVVGLGSNQSTSVALTAIGRQVPITLTNMISGQPSAGVTISALGTTAQTNSQGRATIVLPASHTTISAVLSGAGYNQKTVSITVTAQSVAANDFSLTPSGRVYFLSTISGTIDVVGANLDGTGRATLLKGTGRENPATTQLLASTDWRYLVLVAARDTSQPAIYLLNTSTGKLTAFDTSASKFSLIGWSGDSILYDAVKTSQSAADPGREVIKSYNATLGQLNQLDANQTTGSSTDYAYDSFGNFAVLGNQLLYTTQWSVSGAGNDSTKSDTIRGLTLGSTAAKDYESVPTTTFGYWQSIQTGPQTVMLAAYDSSDSKQSYYTYQSGAVSIDATNDASLFSHLYPRYYLSADNQHVFSAVSRAGQTVLSLSDATGQEQQSVTSNGTYQAAGWYGNYLLLSKSDDQLFIAPSSSASHPTKITSFYQSTVSPDASIYETP